MKKALFRFPVALVAVFFLASCGKSAPTETVHVEGARSAIFGLEKVMQVSETGMKAVRNGALLGIQVAEYISMTPAVAVASGLTGVTAASAAQSTQSTITDPDFKLLAAFSEALSVNVAELLNRSTERQQQLDVYSEALSNVATKANDRYKELSAVEEQASSELRTLKRDLSSAERERKAASSAKDFSLASEKQKIILDLQKQIADKELQVEQSADIVTQLEQMLELYGEKILAMESNREALILGVQVIDVPGVEELQLIKREKSPRKRSRGGGLFDGLF
ncbi:MAG: hypothetical protein ABL890_04470 [Candidatus Peribacteraceae bacterium]